MNSNQLIISQKLRLRKSAKSTLQEIINPYTYIGKFI